MEELPVQAIWSPSPPCHFVTVVSVAHGEASVYTGSTDGSIVGWQLHVTAPPQPRVMLMGHTGAIRHLLPGLAGDDGEGYLLSVDADGGCCLWRQRCGRCVLRRTLPELAGSAFADMPRGEPLTSSWLLAALPAPTTARHAPEAPASKPSLPADGSAAWAHTAGGGSGSGSGTHDGGGDSAGWGGGGVRPPIALVLDWRTLSIVQLLPMLPLQQLLPLDWAAHWTPGSGGRNSAPPSPRADHGACHTSDGVGAAAAASASAAAMAAADPAAAAASAASPGDALLCVRVCCCAVPACTPPPAAPDSLTADSAGNGPRQQSIAVAVAITAGGTLYGCIVPFDPYHPPAWTLGLAEPSAESAAPGSSGCGGPGSPQPCVQPHLQLSQESHEPLLAATLSEDLDVALLGGADAWVVLQARREHLLPPPPSAPPAATAASRSGGGGGGQACVLRLSYSPVCRISLMHQRPAGWPLPSRLPASAEPLPLPSALRGASARMVPRGKTGHLHHQHHYSHPHPHRRAQRQLRFQTMEAGSASSASSSIGSPSSSDQETVPKPGEAALRTDAVGQKLPPAASRAGRRVAEAAASAAASSACESASASIRAATHLSLLGGWRAQAPPAAEGAAVPAATEAACAAPEDRVTPIAPADPGSATLEVLSWDGSGRQQLVTLSAAGAVLDVLELSTPPPPPQRQRQQLLQPPSRLRAGVVGAGWAGQLGSSGIAWGLCCVAQAPGNAAAQAGASESLPDRSSHQGAGGQGDKGECVIVGVHCYAGAGAAAAAADAGVVLWPLRRRSAGLGRAEVVRRRGAPSAAIAPGSGADEAAQVGAGRLSHVAEGPPLVGWLSDAWRTSNAVSTPPPAAGTQGAASDRRIGNGCVAQQTGAAALGPGVQTEAHGSQQDYAIEAAETGVPGHGKLRLRSTTSGAPRGNTNSGSNAITSGSGGSSGGCGYSSSSSDGSSGSSILGSSRSSSAFSLGDSSRSSSGDWQAGAAEGSPESGAVGDECADEGHSRDAGDLCRRRGRRRGLMQAGLACRLHERWMSVRSLAGRSRRSSVATELLGSDVAGASAAFGPSEVMSREAEEAAAAVEDAAADEAVVASSLVACDAGDGDGGVPGIDEAVVLHCTAGGAMRFCDVGAYAAPPVHEPSPTPCHSWAGSTRRRRGAAAPETTAAAAAAAQCGTTRECRLRAAVVGVLAGHQGPVTCMMEVWQTHGSLHTPPAPPPASPVTHRNHPTAVNATTAAAAAAAAAGATRLLLTGAADGSLRAWHTRRGAFGSPLFALHPHGAPIRRLLLPRPEPGASGGVGVGGAGLAAAMAVAAAAPPLDLRHCVASAAEDGSVALVCLARRAVVRMCRAFPYGAPEAVTWSFRRGFLACGGHDPHGNWVVAVFDLAPRAPTLDRLVTGHEARLILEPPAAEPPLAAVVAANASAVASHAAMPPLLGRQHLPPPGVGQPSGGGGGGGGGGMWAEHVPLHHTHHWSDATLPPAAAAVAAAAAAPSLSYATAYGGGLRSVPSVRPDVVLAAVDGEVLLASLAAAAAAAAPAAAASRPVPVPRRTSAHSAAGGAAGSRPSGVAIPVGASPGQLSPMASHSVLSGGASPLSASPIIHGHFIASSHAASLDGPSHAVGASPAAASPSPLTAPLSGNGAGAREAGPSSQFAGSSHGGHCHSVHPYGVGVGVGGSSGRPSVDDGFISTAHPEPARDRSGSGRSAGVHPRASSTVSEGRALAALLSVLHAWGWDPRVDRTLAAAQLELGALRGTDPWVDTTCGDRLGTGDGGSGGSRNGGSVSGGAEGQKRATAGTGTAAAVMVGEAGRACACRGGGGERCACGAGATPPADSPPAMPQAAAATSPPGVQEPGGGEGSAPLPGPCLVQPALVSPCGAVALALPQAPRTIAAPDPRVGDAASLAARLLQLVALSGALGALPAREPASSDAATVATAAAGAGAGAVSPPSHHRPATSGTDAATELTATAATAATRAARHLRQLYVVQGRDELAARHRQRAGAGAGAGAVSLLAPAAMLPGSPRSPVSAYREPDLAVFARRWLAADPWVRQAAQLLLASYTDAAPPLQRPAMEPAHPAAATATSGAVPAEAAAAAAAPAADLFSLPEQATELLRLRLTSSSASSGGAGARPAGVRHGAFSAAACPPPPQSLYPAAIIAGAACLNHPYAVPRELIAAAAAALTDLTCLPLTLSQTATVGRGSGGGSGDSGGGGAGVWLPATPLPAAGGAPGTGTGRGVTPASTSAGAATSAAGGGGGGLWADGGVLLPELAGALLTAALSGPGAEAWRREMQPWGRFMDRLLHLAHTIPLPPPYPPVGAHTGYAPSPLAPGHHDHHHGHPYGSPPALLAPALAAAVSSATGAAPHATTGMTGTATAASAPASAAAAQLAARRVADTAVALLAAAAALDVGELLAALDRFYAGSPLPLHPLLAACLRRLASCRPGRAALAPHAAPLAARLAGCMAAPAARGRPELLRPAQFAAADLAAALPCVALHAGSMQLAAACPLAAPPTSVEPQFITVYDMEYGNATWQLPLQPGPDALAALPAAAAAALAGPALAPRSESGREDRGYGGGAGGGGNTAPPQPPAPLPLGAALRGLARAGVAALQFSPQGDHLAALVLEGAPVPALLVFSLRLPWPQKLMLRPGSLRQALVVQPCHCWLLPGLVQQAKNGGEGTDSIWERAKGCDVGEERVEGPREDRGARPAVGARLAPVLDRVIGLRWSGHNCVELVRSRLGLLARFSLPGG